MIPVGRYWICGEHEPPEMVPVVAEPPPGPVAGRFDRLSSMLAIPLREYVHETHPVMRLHRLCDAVEILTRFAAIVARLSARQDSAQELTRALDASLAEIMRGRDRLEGQAVPSYSELEGRPSTLPTGQAGTAPELTGSFLREFLIVRHRGHPFSQCGRLFDGEAG
jgi:hypothetical protein